MESGQDQADGLHNRKDDLINFSIPVDYSVDCTRNEREELQENDPLELLHSGTMDTQYSLCTKNAAGDLETNTGPTVPQTDLVHLDDAISSTTVTVSYVNRPHLFSSQRILQHSLHEQPLPSLFIPSVCMQSQQMLPASFDSSIPADFVDSSFENSVLAQPGDLDSIRRGLENGIDCSIVSQHRLQVLDLDLPIVASPVHEPGSCVRPLEPTLDTAEETLYEISSASFDVEMHDSVCQFSEVMHQESEWSDIVSPAETVVQNSEVLVIKLTGSSSPESRPNNKEQCESKNLLGRMDHCETQNGTGVFTKSLSSQYTERKLQSVCDLNRNYKDQATMTIKTENTIDFLEAAVPAESEESLSEDTFGQTCPKDLTEGEHNVSPACDRSRASTNSIQPSQSLINPDGYQGAYTESVGTNMSSSYKVAPNACDLLQDSEGRRTPSNIAVLQHMQKTDILSLQGTETEEWSHDPEVALTSVLKNEKMHCSGWDAKGTQNNSSVKVSCKSEDTCSMVFPCSGDLTPNIQVTEQSLSNENSCREARKQISTRDATRPNLKEIPDSVQVVNDVCENSRGSASFSNQTFPSLQKPSATESNHPRIKPCSLELHKLNVLETEGKCDVRGYVLDLKRNNVASMSCSISMSLSLAKSGKSVDHGEEAEPGENCDGNDDQSPSSDNVCKVLSVQAGPQIPNRRKQTLVAKYEDSEVVCISDEEIVSCPVAKTDVHQDRAPAQENKKRRTPCHQHANQKKFEDRPLQNDSSTKPKHFERKILPPRQRGMRLEQIVQNMVAQPKSRTPSGLSERLRRSKDTPTPTPTRFQPPRRKSSSSVAEQKSKGSTGLSPYVRDSSQKTMTSECKMQEQKEAGTIAAEKPNTNKSTSISGSCHEHATKLSTPVSPAKSFCGTSSSSKQLVEISREVHTSGSKQTFSDPGLKCLNGNRRKQAANTKNATQPRRGGTARKKIRKPAGKKRQTQRGQASSFFAPEEPEIKLRALTLKAEDRRDRYDSFTPYVRVEAKGYSMCTVVNYSEEDNNNLKRKKHSQRQSHGAVPKSSCLTLGPTINEATHKSFLVCCLCGQSANAMEQGDLFGPFYPGGYTPSSNQTARSKEAKIEQASTVVSSPNCTSIRNAVNKTPGQNQELRTREGATTRGQKRRSLDGVEEATKYSDNKKPRSEPSLEEWYQPPLVPMDTNEYWMHEDCVTWCAGVFLVRGKLYGLLEAINVAQETLCSMCQRTGATLGCYIKGCPLKYHYACAVDSKCFLNEDNFSMKCTKHKDKALKVSVKGDSR
uniref:serine-rich adhesin for platelets n=1 Tax=Pristiophorus japonicus TaxID=55135 RepID=UPI00398F398B